MLNLPVYLRGSSYYFHTRIFGKQFKRSLHTTDRLEAIIRASRYVESVVMAMDLSKIKKYELDLSKGIAKANDAEDHQRMIEALSLLKEVQKQHQPPSLENPVPTAHTASQSLTLSELLDKYLLLKKVKPATIIANKNMVKDFEKFYQSKCHIGDILVSDITRYQEHLAIKGNSSRTIDNKVGLLKAMLYFGMKQGYLLKDKNPAENMTLLSKKQKEEQGYLIFEPVEIKQIYLSEYFIEQKKNDPDYYYVLLLALITGCRVSELTSLTKSQFQLTEVENHLVVIRDSKTSSGKREIPLPKYFFDDDFNQFIKLKEDFVFKYASREGKGSGNAVGKKFSRHLNELKINRGKLVFHSLRKFSNDYFMKNGLEIEPRSQMFGHEIASTNVNIYTKKFNADELCELINPLQIKLLMMIGVIRTNF